MLTFWDYLLYAQGVPWNWGGAYFLYYFDKGLGGGSGPQRSGDRDWEPEMTFVLLLLEQRCFLKVRAGDRGKNLF